MGMFYSIETFFKDCEVMIKLKTKSDYEQNTTVYLQRTQDEFEGFFSAVDEAGIEVAVKDFVEKAFSLFEKRGKVKQSRLITINYQMIYYIFPTILKLRDEDGTKICDCLKDAWNEVFKCNINYADYDTLSAGFVTKFFGIPVNSIGFGKRD